MGEKKRTLRGFLCAALGGVCWGASGTVGQYLFTCQGVDSGWLTVVRMFLAGVVLLGGALVRHPCSSARRQLQILRRRR